MATSLSFYANVFGFIVGGLSLLGLLMKLCRSQLPSNKIKVLENVLNDTENTLIEAVEGRQLEGEFVEETTRQLAELRDRTRDLQSRATDASICEDCAEFLSGTSITIGCACRTLRKLRAKVISVSRERPRLTEIVPASNTTPSPSALPSGPNPLTISSHQLIRRPPPVFLGWELRVASRRARWDPFSDAMRGNQTYGQLMSVDEHQLNIRRSPSNRTV